MATLRWQPTPDTQVPIVRTILRTWPMLDAARAREIALEGKISLLTDEEALRLGVALELVAVGLVLEA